MSTGRQAGAHPSQGGGQAGDNVRRQAQVGLRRACSALLRSLGFKLHHEKPANVTMVKRKALTSAEF